MELLGLLLLTIVFCFNSSLQDNVQEQTNSSETNNTFRKPINPRTFWGILLDSPKPPSPDLNYPGAPPPQGRSGPSHDLNYPGAPPPQGRSGPSPDHNYTGAPPPQGRSVSFPDLNYTGAPPPQVRSGSSPALNCTGAPPPQALPGSSPALRLLSNQTASYLQGPTSTLLIPIFYILTLVLGVPGNLFILCTVASKVRKASAALLYCSLALSDLLLLCSLTFRAHYHLQGNHWAFGETACRLVSACFYGNLYCSSQTLACISVKRYLAVVHPFRYRSLPKRTCTAWVTLVLWMVFAAGLVPEMLVRQSYWIPQLGIITCHDILPLGLDSHRFLLYYNVVLAVLGLLVPLVMSVLCNVGILAELNRAHSDWGMYIRSSSLVFIIFLVCFTPAGVLHFVHYVQLFADGTEVLYMYFNVAVCLCCLHAALDPFLFVLMSRSTKAVPHVPYIKGFKSKNFSLST